MGYEYIDHGACPKRLYLEACSGAQARQIVMNGD